MLCVCVGDVMDVVFSVCIVRRGAVGVSVSSCRCCMFVSCVHPVAVLNSFCSMPLLYGRLLHPRPALTNCKSCRTQH